MLICNLSHHSVKFLSEDCPGVYATSKVWSARARGNFWKRKKSPKRFFFSCKRGNCLFASSLRHTQRSAHFTLNATSPALPHVARLHSWSVIDCHIEPPGRRDVKIYLHLHITPTGPPKISFASTARNSHGANHWTVGETKRESMHSNNVVADFSFNLVWHVIYAYAHMHASHFVLLCHASACICEASNYLFVSRAFCDENSFISFTCNDGPQKRCPNGGANRHADCHWEGVQGISRAGRHLPEPEPLTLT